MLVVMVLVIVAVSIFSSVVGLEQDSVVLPEFLLRFRRRVRHFGLGNDFVDMSFEHFELVCKSPTEGENEIIAMQLLCVF